MSCTYMFAIDMTDWLNKLFSDTAPPPLKVRLKKLAEIITYATSNMAGISFYHQPRCWKRPDRKPCRDVLEITFVPENDKIRWRCPTCGNEGEITGWRGEFWDMTSSFTAN